MNYFIYKGTKVDNLSITRFVFIIIYKVEMSTKRYQYQSQFIIKTTKLGNLVGNSQLKYIASMYCIHLLQFLGHLKMYCISNTALASRLSCDKRQQ